MKKHLKGFTLIECIVAMAIMGIASLLMVQVYGTVALINRDNRKMNNSLEIQMKYAEEQLTTSGGDVKVSKMSSYEAGSTIDPIKFKMISGPNLSSFKDNGTDMKAQVDLYVISSELTGNSTETPGVARSVQYDDNTIRYKFILPEGYDEYKGQGGSTP